MPWYAQGSSTTPTAGKFTVRFRDYDGEILLLRTVDPGWSVAPPATPTHAGLTFAGWSETGILVDRDMDIVANYTVDDGKMHVFVDASALAGSAPTLKFSKGDAQPLLVEWGDGTTSTTSASGNVTITKSAPYADGSYEILVSGSGVFSGGFATTSNQMVAGVAVTEIWISDAATSVPEYMCNGAAFRTMRAIAGGAGVVSIGASAFRYCYALVSASFPLAASIGATAFQGCVTLVSASFPLAASIGASAFQYCRALAQVTIGPNCTLVGVFAFDGCLNLLEFVCEATTPPALSSVDAFADYDPRMLVKVPAASVAAYQAATNWSAFAARIVAI